MTRDLGSGRVGQMLLRRVERMLTEFKRNFRVPASRLEGSIGFEHLPPGTSVPDPTGGGGGYIVPGPHSHLHGDVSDWQAAVYASVSAILQEGTNITMVKNGVTIVISASGGGGVTPGSFGILFDEDGNIIYDEDGNIVTYAV